MSPIYQGHATKKFSLTETLKLVFRDNQLVFKHNKKGVNLRERSLPFRRMTESCLQRTSL